MSGTVVEAHHTSLPVAYPDDYLQPLEDPGVIEYKQIDFKKEGLPRYENCYAAVLDNILTRQECRQLLRYIEMSAGLHRDEPDDVGGSGEPVDASPSNDGIPTLDGWQAAGLNSGPNFEVIVPSHRRSKRIIWDEREISRRVWARIIQSAELKHYLSGDLTDKTKYPTANPLTDAQSITLIEDALNVRLRCLKYDKGDFFACKCASLRSPPPAFSLSG